MTEFEHIYETYFADVYRYIRRLSGDEHTAEEITSQTFFKALNALDSFRGDCDVRVWLCQIAKNCYYSYYKTQTRPKPEIPDHWDSPEDALLRREEAEGLRKLLHELPEPYREVFMWRVFAQLSFRQIGGLFQKTENWACVTYHRGRKMLQARLEEQNEK